MDDDSSTKFIGSLTKFLQSLCNGYVEFRRGVELVGHIYLNIDTGEKVDYILHEKVSKNDENSVTFVSNSFHAQPQEKDKPKESPSKSGANERSRDTDDTDDDIMIVDQSRGTIGSTNSGSVPSRGMKRPGSPNADYKRHQGQRAHGLTGAHPSAQNRHSFPLSNRQHAGRPSATVTSQGGSSQNENLNISEVKLEQISRDEMLSLTSQVDDGRGTGMSHASSSRSHPQHSGAGVAASGSGGSRGDPAMWVKQEVPDDEDGGADTGWSQERDDSNSNSSSSLYPTMLHQNPIFASQGFSGHGGGSGGSQSGGANLFPMPGTSQDMSGLDPSVPYWLTMQDVPLPPAFEGEMLPALKNPRKPLEHSARLKMAGVAASFYFAEHDEQLRHPSAYRLIGRRMMEVYPALMAAEGAHPWTEFMKAVSYKVRRKRFSCRHSGQQRLTMVTQLPGDDVRSQRKTMAHQQEDDPYHYLTMKGGPYPFTDHVQHAATSRGDQYQPDQEEQQGGWEGIKEEVG